MKTNISVPLSINDILYGYCKTCKHQKLYLEDEFQGLHGFDLLGHQYVLHCEHEEVCYSYDSGRED